MKDRTFSEIIKIFFWNADLQKISALIRFCGFGAIYYKLSFDSFTKYQSLTLRITEQNILVLTRQR